MTSKFYFILLIAIVIFGFVLDLILDYLNKTYWNDKLPKELKDVYDETEYKRSLKYKQTNYRFGIISGSFSFALIIAMLILRGFAFADDVASQLANNNIILTGLFFFGIIMFASDLLGIPFEAYSTFIIEEKFGFNKTTKKTFFLDKIKGWLLAIILGGGILALIIWFYQLTTDLFWLYTWGVLTVFMVFITMFYSNLIVPLFNKQTPLEEGELKDCISDFATKTGFELDNVYVIDGSKRSTKANAYFTGLGKKKRIVLYDTLIKDLTKEEIVAVLAHEIGHYKKKHTLTGMIISILQTGLTLYILSLFVGNTALSQALGALTAKFHLGLIAFGIIYSPISMVLGLVLNNVSRKNEYQADAFAAEHYDAQHLVSALKKLAGKNLSNLTPHPIYVYFHFSHPTLLQRIKALNKLS